MAIWSAGGSRGPGRPRANEALVAGIASSRLRVSRGRVRGRPHRESARGTAAHLDEPGSAEGRTDRPCHTTTLLVATRAAETEAITPAVPDSDGLGDRRGSGGGNAPRKRPDRLTRAIHGAAQGTRNSVRVLVRQTVPVPSVRICWKPSSEIISFNCPASAPAGRRSSRP